MLCVVLLLVLPALACSFSVETSGETPEPTPPVTGPHVYDVLFASGMTADKRPIDPAAEFPPGTSPVHAFASCEGMTDDLECESVWYVDGVEDLRDVNT